MNFLSRSYEALTILHVEDSDADAKLVELRIKQTQSYRSKIIRACDIENALHVLSEQTVDLVLLDLFLPDSQGLETLKRLRSEFPENAVVVITGTDEEATALQAVKIGAQDYLVKDELNPRSIARTIRYSIERHHYDRHVMQMAHLDMLTGLPNRVRCLDYLQNAIESAHRLKHALNILFIDCDNFKTVNDTMGHAKGDEFLVHIATTLRNCMRSSDFVARLAGDEFVVIVQSRGDSVKSPLILGEKIIDKMQQGFRFSSGETFEARCSIGITHYSGNANKPTADKLLHEADSAMYESKRRGGNCSSFFDRGLEEQAERRLRLLREILLAVRKQSFELHYQPIMSAAGQTVAGMEALLRWDSDTGETISPCEFIPLLEENAHIHAVGKWILTQACSDFLKLRTEGAIGSDTWISVNISPVQLRATNFASMVKKIIETTGMRPSNLHFEITESLLMEQSEQTLSMLEELRDVGCHWVIDDFGVGYSSMNYLRVLPISTLKIDRSFIQHGFDDSRNAAIIRAIIALAHKLDMRVVAEGIETIDAQSFLTEENADFLQGFLFSKALAFNELHAFCQHQHHPELISCEPPEKRQNAH